MDCADHTCYLYCKCVCIFPVVGLLITLNFVVKIARFFLGFRAGYANLPQGKGRRIYQALTKWAAVYSAQSSVPKFGSKVTKPIRLYTYIHSSYLHYDQIPQGGATGASTATISRPPEERFVTRGGNKSPKIQVPTLRDLVIYMGNN